MDELSLESIVKSDEDVLIAALLEADEPVDWYVREGTPVPNEQTWKQLAFRAQIVTSMTESARDYLGDLEYVSASYKFGQVFLFPTGVQKVLCLVTKSGKQKIGLIENIQQRITKME
ncbi:hypothetical protein NTE_00244 [Candidatus Nitrososphaera evergladensis SR1]|uniref:Roadblock/LAMTOR2 domain-containing protein n=2 Tax=Nitrososphaera TaxID=497726 RepID=A0A075MLI8_9ARCH|nr:hypothetical protein NTE_00244 [Candidatus Nitrososphaera evergladensis SR1]